jgi:type IV fimbrial biogenesis protein FimT
MPLSSFRPETGTLPLFRIEKRKCDFRFSLIFKGLTPDENGRKSLCGLVSTPSGWTLPSKHLQAGLTLLELMIGLAIVAILITVVTPNVREMLIQNRIVAEINELSGLMQFARATAIDQQATVVLCPSSDFSTCTSNWQLSKIVFVDENGNGERDDASEKLLVAANSIASQNRMTGPSGRIRFQDNGVTSSPATLLLCHGSREAKFARALTLSLQGRVKMSRNTNNDGIYENNSGTALRCD